MAAHQTRRGSEGNGTGTHAVVIGGSMAGLLTARVLTDHFDRVTLVERDAMHDGPEARKGQPQAHHLHALLSEGVKTLNGFFPGLQGALADGGAFVSDVAETMHWYCYGGYRMQFTSGLVGVIVSRPFLEWEVRHRTMALPNLTVLDACAVQELLPTEDRARVTGVTVEHRGAGERHETISADLIVDASGRGSAAPRWLESLGYKRPGESFVKIGVGYATRAYRRDPEDPRGREWHFVAPEAPVGKSGGGAFPIEGDRWLVTLAGIHGHYPPSDEQGFLEFARGLPVPDIYNLMRDTEPTSEIAQYRFPGSLRRHYENLARFPEGFLVIGDALCSFNPVYGQGMTVAAMEARTLDTLLRQRSGPGWLQGIARTYFKRVASVIDTPWQMATGEDFRYPETEGEKPPGTDLLNAYTLSVNRATHSDPVVGEAFLRVINLLQRPTSLFRPNILLRVARASLGSQRDATRPQMTVPQRH
jgi:2-polyprenyl-6-methoxyphenol hydroxylase-like FAD-dependent oxidoreductase